MFQDMHLAGTRSGQAPGMQQRTRRSSSRKLPPVQEGCYYTNDDFSTVVINTMKEKSHVYSLELQSGLNPVLTLHNWEIYFSHYINH